MRRAFTSTLLTLAMTAAPALAADTPAAKKSDAKPAAAARTKPAESPARKPTVVDPRDEPEVSPAKKPEAKKPDAKTTATKKPEKALTPGGVYRAGDMSRPRPVVVAPGAAYGTPPADAIVLFDGKDLTKWNGEPRRVPTPKPSAKPAGKETAAKQSASTTRASSATKPEKPPEAAVRVAAPAPIPTPKPKAAPTGTRVTVAVTTVPDKTVPAATAPVAVASATTVTPKAEWKLADGYMEVPQPRIGGIVTKDEFGSCQIHIEWATPAEVKGNGQGRGNSGIMLHGIAEVQVLDSYENDTYPDGQAAAIYNRYPPLANASRKPGEWQTYDIVVQLADIDEKTKEVKRPARITVMHNGVIVQHASEVDSRATKFKLALQDHGNPVRYRNIWIRPLVPAAEKNSKN
jgi:hypothetical protein